MPVGNGVVVAVEVIDVVGVMVGVEVGVFETSGVVVSVGDGDGVADSGFGS